MTAHAEGTPSPSRHWTREMTRYHWFVLMVAALGWLFDTMDQQLFTLARVPAMQELLRPSPGEAANQQDIDFYGPLATSIFLIGWATGGLAFGVLGDRIGRARTMLWTILLYSLCTGLSSLSVGFKDFAFYRFLTGLGVGGEFAVGVALVAEVMPSRARPFALGLLQALSAVGNISAALIGLGLAQLERMGLLADLRLFPGHAASAWRVMFVVGTVPALLAVVIRRRLKEPERWQSAAAAKDKAARLGSYGELFGHPRWRRHALLGMLLAFSGVVGLWGIGFFTPDLLGSVLTKAFKVDGISDDELKWKLMLWKSIALIVQNMGGFFGIWAFSRITHVAGRRPTFFVFFVLAMVTTAFVFWRLQSVSELFWMLPIMGFFQFALFGGYAIYFPELFPTYLRSTGTSFCYNVGRFVAAVGPFTFGYLTSEVFQGYPEPMRYAGMSMSAIFLLGLVVLPFVPETRGQPLPE